MDVPIKLIVLSEQLRGNNFTLTDDIYSIGRAGDMGIQLDDQTVSGHHCDLERRVVDGKVAYWVVDEQMSTNGTRINGTLVTCQQLISGDILQVGSVECMYESDADLLPDTTSTNTEIKLEDDVIQINTKTQNLKPSKWQTSDHRMRLWIKVALSGLAFTVLGLATWLILTLLQKPV